MKKNVQLSDLWDETCRGNVEAFSLIHRELYPVLFHYLLKIFRDDDISQDVLQDLFVKLWERRESIGPIQNVKVYFFKTARSLAFNYLKNPRNNNMPIVESMLTDFVFSEEEVQINNENNLEVRQILANALNELPKRQKEIIFLKYFDGWNYDEIADVTGIKYQSVLNHVHRGMLQLRNKLAENKSFHSCRMAG